MRGRLLFSFFAEMYRVDRATTRNVSPDGSPRGGYDDDFKEPVLVDSDGDGLNDFQRAEIGPILVRCQVEPMTNEALRMMGAGDSPVSGYDLVFHYGELESLGLVDENTGDALLKVGDRLASLRGRDGLAVQSFPDCASLYAVEVRPMGFGFGLTASRRNLLLMRFRDRSARGL